MKYTDLPHVLKDKASRAFSRPQNLHPHLLRVIHGRKKQSTEYVEYRIKGMGIKFVAQKSGDKFFIYEMGKEYVRTLAQFDKADSAANQAHDMAYNRAIQK